MAYSYLRDGQGNLIVDANGDYVVVPAEETVTRELPWRPQQPTRQTLAWLTDLHKMHDGSERRLSLRDRPRMTLRYEYLLDEHQQRQYRAMLKNDTDQSWKVPLWHESFRTTDYARSYVALGTPTDYLSITDAAQTGLDFSDKLTIAAWVRVSSISNGTARDMVNKSEVGDSDFYNAYLYQDAGARSVRIFFGGSNEAQALHQLSLDEWMHLAWVYDGTLSAADRVRILVDGEEKSVTITGTVPATLADNAADFEVGGFQGSASWDGDIAHVRAWSAALTQAEIQAEMRSDVPARTAGLQLALPLTADADDTSVNGNDMTENGSPTYQASAVADFSNTDLQANDLVFVEGGHDFLRGGEFATVQSVASGEITLDSLSRSYEAGAEVVPAVNAQVRPGVAWSRPAQGLDQAPLDLIVTEMRPTGGSGATVSTYQGEPLLDRRPIVRADVNEGADADLDILDLDQLIAVETGRTEADLTRSHAFRIDDHDELQWWRKFLDTVRGRWKRCYSSTWRPDLLLASTPAGGDSEIEVITSPDFDTRWFQGGQTDIQIETDDEGIVQRRVASVTDNGDTQTLALDASLPGSGDIGVSKVSFLELVRLATDEAEFIHSDTVSVVQIGLRTLQSEATESPSTFADYDKSIQDGEPIHLIKLEGPTPTYTYYLTNYSADVSFGGDTYSAVEGGIEYESGESGSLDMDDQTIVLPASEQIVEDYIREPNRSVDVTVTALHGTSGQSRVIFRGALGGITTEGHRASLLITPGLGDPVRRVIPSIRASPNCQNRLGDAVCQVDLELAANKTTVTVDSISGLDVTLQSGHGRSDGYWDNGKLVDTTGEIRRIRKHVGDVLTLSYPMKDLNASDVVTAYTGCKKTITICRDKFDNVENFVGTPYTPGKEILHRGMSAISKGSV